MPPREPLNPQRVTNELLLQAIHHLEEKLDEHIDQDHETRLDHEDRLRKLEDSSTTFRTISNGWNLANTLGVVLGSLLGLFKSR